MAVGREARNKGELWGGEGEQVSTTSAAVHGT